MGLGTQVAHIALGIQFNLTAESPALTHHQGAAPPPPMEIEETQRNWGLFEKKKKKKKKKKLLCFPLFRIVQHFEKQISMTFP